MKKFLVLYMAPSAEFKKMMEKAGTMTQEERNKGMKVWETWMTENKEALKDPGGPVGKTKKVTAKGSSDAHNDVGGYSILQAESHDAACKMMESNPHFEQMPGAWIEVMEIMEMPEM